MFHLSRKSLDELTSQEVVDLAAKLLIRTGGLKVEAIYPDAVQPGVALLLPDGRRMVLEMVP
jgi:hypothetical protein